MLKTIQYLEEKNMYLEKFFDLNRMWLDRLSRGDYAEIENFRETREQILNIVKHIDALIEAHSSEVIDEPVQDLEKNRIHHLLGRKDALVRVILSQDLEIMEIIEEAKSQIITELRQVSKSKKTIGSYKSFNRKENLNEEV